MPTSSPVPSPEPQSTAPHPAPVGGQLEIRNPADLEQRLLNEPVIDEGGPFSAGVHKVTARYVLANRLNVQAKFASADEADGERIIRREAAAWVIAKHLGWTDMVGATVIRSMPLPDGTGVDEASIQVVWAPAEANKFRAFPEEDIWRAAVFDYLIEQSDRHNHNWLVQYHDDGTPRLRLIDHGYSFGMKGRRLASKFHSFRRNESVPEWILEDIRRLLAELDESELPDLLEREAISALRGRAERLLDRRVLPD